MVGAAEPHVVRAAVPAEVRLLRGDIISQVLVVLGQPLHVGRRVGHQVEVRALRVLRHGGIVGKQRAHQALAGPEELLLVPVARPG